MGGDWHDLGGALADDASAPVALQPLARVDDAGERAWAAEWVATLLARESVTVTPELKEHLWSALTSLASAPVPERTITGLSVLLQSNALKQALQPYTVAGPWGRLLDAETERLGEAEVQAFETEGLIGAGAAPAVLSYLFHRIEDRFDGRPTLLIVDEGWLALDDPGFAGQLREWLKTLRKKNASVIFATQSLADIDGSAIAPAIIESCPTRILSAKRARARAADRGDLPALRPQRPADRDPEPGDAEARILLPVAPRQSPVRARPLRSRARLHRRLVEDRPDRHRRDPRRPRPRRVRRRMAAPQGPRLGGRHAHPQRGGFVMITRRLRAGLIAGVAALSIAAAAFPRTRSGSSSTRPTSRRTS